MSNVAEYRQRAIDTAQKAVALDNEGKFEEAKQLYVQALDRFQLAIKYESNERMKQMMKDKFVEHMLRAEKIKDYLKGLEDQKPKASKTAETANGGKVTKSGSKKDEEDVDSETQKLKSSLSGAILSEVPNIKWEDVAGLEGAKEALKEAVILPIKFPHLFKGRRKPWKGILLYGPPGTGKSYLAKAVATEAKSTFFSVSSSDLVSKWMGESERLVKQLFQMARENKPAIIFIDEVDSLCGTRGEGESEASRRIKTQFLVQMQGVGNDMEGVLVLGATNIPWQLDPAIRRRFEKRIFIPLPDSAARYRMFELNIGDTPHTLKQSDFKQLAQMTEGYSGSDIAIAVADALMSPIRTIQQATHFRWIDKTLPDSDPPVTKKFLTPCSPGAPGAIEKSWMDIEADELAEPDLSMKDFIKSLKNIKATVNADDVVQFTDFTNDFGSEGA